MCKISFFIMELICRKLLEYSAAKKRKTQVKEDPEEHEETLRKLQSYIGKPFSEEKADQ